MPNPLDGLVVHGTDLGLYCPAGGFHIDPSDSVADAVITHAHGDHARRGSARYWCATPGAGLLRRRLGQASQIHARGYGERWQLGRATVSLHPAGHILGSAQVRIEVDGQVWVVSGDYKRDPDPTAAPFEVVRCDTFVTESTFGDPRFEWPDASVVARQIIDWWRANRAAGRPSVLFCYALGKAQRLLAEIGRQTDDSAWVHGAIAPLNDCYRDAGVALPVVRAVSSARAGRRFQGDLILAPPGARGTPWMKRFAGAATGFVSGWMQDPRAAGARGYDCGFVLSDHADWPSLLRTCAETGAARVFAVHGDSAQLVAALNATGVTAAALPVAATAVPAALTP